MQITSPANRVSPEELIEQLLALPDIEAQKQLLTSHRTSLDERFADGLKKQADIFLRSEIDRSLRFADLLLHVGTLIQNPLVNALGLLAQGNALSIGLGEYEKALIPFAEAFQLYGDNHRSVGQGRVEIGRMWALACLGRYQEAFDSGARARQIFEGSDEWRLLATATLNLAIIYCRHGDDATALTLYDQADELYQRIGLRGAGEWLWVQQSRAVSLRNLGRFDEAIAAVQSTYQMLKQLGQSVEAARAQQNLALTYYVLGRYNEALENLDQAYAIFRNDGRQRDAMLVELFTSDCLLQLRRFDDVLEKCQRVRQLFGERGAQEVVAQAIVNEAVAYTNLGRFAEALASLQEAHNSFQQVGNQVWMAMTNLETAAIFHRQGRHADSFAVAQTAAAVFQQHGLIVEAGQAFLIAAHAALALGQTQPASELTHTALVIGTDKNLPTLNYQAHQLLGLLAEQQSDPTLALAQFDQALDEVERVRGRLMVEHRANFLEDKQEIYEHAVRLCLATNQAAKGLEYAERAKSRSLLDLLTYRLDLSIQARQAADTPLVEELSTLRAQRDRLYRRWESNEEVKLRGWTPSDGEQMQQQEILTLEKQITDLWHKLLVHNADYARDAALWQVRTESPQPYLPPDTLLLEYFSIGGTLVAFLVTSETIQAQHLACKMSELQRLMQLLQVNLNLTPRSNPKQISALTGNARGLLHQLYQQLLQPLRAQLAKFQRLIIVPHGPLHYLPIHALFDGQHYLIETHEISYLPAASFLRYCHETKPAKSGALLYGHSWQNRLPHTLHEVNAIAAILGEKAISTVELDRPQLAQLAHDCRILHLATHGDFRADNPLFSGLLIGDSWLTTLDIFNLQLRASLVTLSGCQTGRNVVQGGDELAGLMRAFLSAGAASLALSLWAVEDQSTSHLMQAFYRHLMAGCSKGKALALAQRQFIQQQAGQEYGQSLAHPYFWAPFFLVGDSGQL